MNQTRPRILIVDDELPQAEALGKLLADDGYGVECLGVPAQALERLSTGTIDICISDYRMPHMTGIELHREVRSLGLEVIFIIATAYGTIEEAVQAIREGVYDYIEKPVNLDILGATLHRAEEAYLLRRENRELKEKVAALSGGESIIAESAPMQAVIDRIEQVAP